MLCALQWRWKHSRHRLVPGELVTELSEAGQNFVDQLSVREQNGFGESVVRDYSPGIAHIDQCLHALRERTARCLELVELRQLKSEQKNQMLAAETEIEQV